jgi:hypothetical protein
METVVHAIVGLVLFALLLAGGLIYIFVVVGPELFQNHQVALIYERLDSLLPDFSSGEMPVAMTFWAAAGFIGASALGAAYIFLASSGRWRGAGPFWGWIAATAALVAPPLVCLFLLPSVPKIKGGNIWWFLTGGGLAAALAYVGWMYYRDSRGVGPLWGVLLGLLRGAVFTLFAFFFMLPAVRPFTNVYSRSKVLVLFDVSGSMVQITDDLPSEAHPNDVLPTRQDKVLAFLSNESINFLRRLETKNPVDVYRFARSLDPEFLHFSKENRNWTRAEYDAWLKDPNRDRNAPAPGAMPPELWETWLKPGALVKPTDRMREEQQQRFSQFLDLNKALIDDQRDEGADPSQPVALRTNVGDALKALLNNESNKMPQGVVVFTDGRSNEGSLATFDELKELAKTSRVPIFVVAIGEERPKVNIDVTDVRVPPQIQPDDKFPASVEATGEGLAGQAVDVSLELTYVHKDKNGKEELLPIGLVESLEEKPNAPKVTPQLASLGTRIVLHPTEPAKFDGSSPPRVEAPFQIDAASLAAAAGVDLSKPPYNKVRKWEIAETVQDGEFRFRAHIPRAEKEAFADKEHLSDPAEMRVQKKPLRVLLFAGAATHEYQFCETILVRDQKMGRVKASTFLQPAPGQKDVREGIKQDAQLLTKFPDQFDPGVSGKEENPYDLSQYDVIVAFDPDWEQLDEKQMAAFAKWAGAEPDSSGVRQNGGLIYVAGPVNTVNLARPANTSAARLQPITTLLPVVLKDIRLEESNRETSEPWPLTFPGATPDMEFLRLQEDTPEKPVKFLDDWKEFFGPLQPDGSSERGFYNFYPLDSAKPGAVVVAAFADPRVKAKDANGQDSLMPFVVVSNPAVQRVVWIGWGDMWRLRQKHEAYLERFWTKLTRYAGGLHNSKVVNRITPNFGRVFKVNQPIVMQANIQGKGGVPLDKDSKPTIVKLTPLMALPKLTDDEAKELDGLTARHTLTAAETSRKKQLEDEKASYDRAQKDLLELQKDKIMEAVPKRDGWFQVRFTAPVAGKYQMDLTATETGDKLPYTFTVKPSNPELDDPRPDFAQMYDTASYADEIVKPRMSAKDYEELMQYLQRQRPKLDDKKPSDDRPRLYFNLADAGLIPKCMTEIENNDTRLSQAHPVWDEKAAFQWLPWWAAALIGVVLTVGFLAGFFLSRSNRPAAVMRGLLAAPSVGGFAIGRNLGWGGWVLLAGLLILLIGPLFLPSLIPLGWFLFTTLIGLLSMEWLIRKLLRLA